MNSEPSRDHVDWIGELWARERPDADIAPLATWGRLKRAAALVDRSVAATVANTGLKLGVGEFEVLAALRRSGEPYRLNPSELRKALIVSGGTVTNRVGGLERKGLVTRAVQADDGRGRLVCLTASGKELFDDAFAAIVDLLAEIVRPIEDEQDQLADILRRLLVPFGDWDGFTPAPDIVPRRVGAGFGG
jgi:DNA-binding MarR family transcriptional regulator